MERIPLSTLLPPVDKERTAVYRIFNRHGELLYVGMTDYIVRRFTGAPKEPRRRLVA
jgi:hypothetical protein